MCCEFAERALEIADAVLLGKAALLAHSSAGSGAVVAGIRQKGVEALAWRQLWRFVRARRRLGAECAAALRRERANWFARCLNRRASA